VWDESSASNAGVVAIPSQFKVIQQILQLKFVGSLHLEQLRSNTSIQTALTSRSIRTENSRKKKNEEREGSRIP
jgi:hypothetical protein